MVSDDFRRVPRVAERPCESGFKEDLWGGYLKSVPTDLDGTLVVGIWLLPCESTVGSKIFQRGAAPYCPNCCRPLCQPVLKLNLGQNRDPLNPPLVTAPADTNGDLLDSLSCGNKHVDFEKVPCSMSLSF